MGDVLVKQCPRKEIASHIAEFVEFAIDARDGNFPLSGGMLEQSDTFRFACRYLRSLEKRIEEEKPK